MTGWSGWVQLPHADAVEAGPCRRTACRWKAWPEEDTAVESERADSQDPGSGSWSQTQHGYRRASQHIQSIHLPPGIKCVGHSGTQRKQPPSTSRHVLCLLASAEPGLGRGRLPQKRYYRHGNASPAQPDEPLFAL